jgi:predicted neutral ceramidase superfamily lipid hydrolase
MGSENMTKLKAASYHFVISVIVFSIIFSVFILLWFPQPYFIVTGGWQGLIIAAAVDIVLGPLLTFIVFNAAKPTKNLKFDLSIIVLIQFSALILGIHTIYQQRPVANVFWKGTFSTVNAVSLTEQGVDLKLLSALSEAKPAFIYLKAHKGQKYYLSGEQKG